jgi:hypothetical protein
MTATMPFTGISRSVQDLGQLLRSLAGAGVYDGFLGFTEKSTTVLLAMASRILIDTQHSLLSLLLLLLLCHPYYANACGSKVYNQGFFSRVRHACVGAPTKNPRKPLATTV